jgi:hypothetical protein
MTATQQLKQALITYLSDQEIDGVTVVDETQRAAFILPIIAIGIDSAEVFNPALPMVHKASVNITLRAHSGDEDESDMATWANQIESCLHDRSAVSSVLSDANLKMHEWTYNGSVEEWDDVIYHVTFSAECVIQRMS